LTWLRRREEEEEEEEEGGGDRFLHRLTWNFCR
jgi:hypothetical protein